MSRAKKQRKSAMVFTDAVAAFWKLTVEQKLSVVIGVTAAVYLLPKVLLLGFVGVERALISAIITVESALLVAVQSLVAVAAGVGIVGFVLLTIMSFLFPRKGIK
jgi:hypothetical protein